MPNNIQGNQQKECRAFGNLSNSVIFKPEEVIIVASTANFTAIFKLLKNKY